MFFLPGSCERCRSTCVVCNADCVDGLAVCPGCDGPLQLWSGLVYPEGDVPLFHALVAIVESSALTNKAAQHLAIVIQGARMIGGDAEALSEATQRLPALRPVEGLLSASPSRACVALSMLSVIVQARARERTGSGTSFRAPVRAAQEPRNSRKTARSSA